MRTARFITLQPCTPQAAVASGSASLWRLRVRLASAVRPGRVPTADASGTSPPPRPRPYRVAHGAYGRGPGRRCHAESPGCAGARARDGKRTPPRAARASARQSIVRPLHARREWAVRAQIDRERPGLDGGRTGGGAGREERGRHTPAPTPSVRPPTAVATAAAAPAVAAAIAVAAAAFAAVAADDADAADAAAATAAATAAAAATPPPPPQTSPTRATVSADGVGSRALPSDARRALTLRPLASRRRPAPLRAQLEE